MEVDRWTSNPSATEGLSTLGFLWQRQAYVKDEILSKADMNMRISKYALISILLTFRIRSIVNDARLLVEYKYEYAD